jgi:hypothetical protein
VVLGLDAAVSVPEVGGGVVVAESDGAALPEPVVEGATDGEMPLEPDSAVDDGDEEGVSEGVEVGGDAASPEGDGTAVSPQAVAAFPTPLP